MPRPGRGRRNARPSHWGILLVPPSMQRPIPDKRNAMQCPTAGWQTACRSFMMPRTTVHKPRSRMRLGSAGEAPPETGGRSVALGCPVYGHRRQAGRARPRLLAIRARAALLAAFLEHRLQFGREVPYVLELAVDAGEADVSHLVQQPQVLHDQLPHVAAFDLGIEVRIDLVLHLGHDRLDLIAGDRPLPAGFFQPLFDLGPLEGDPRAVLLDYLHVQLIDLLVRGVAAATLQ